MSNAVKTVVEFTPFQKRVISFIQLWKFLEEAQLTDDEQSLARGEKWVEFFVSIEARGIKVPFE